MATAITPMVNTRFVTTTSPWVQSSPIISLMVSLFALHHALQFFTVLFALESTVG